MTKSAVLILPLMAYLFCIAPELMMGLFGKQYEWSAVPFRIYLLQLPIRTITFGAILQATGNNQYILIQSILSLAANFIIGWYLTGVLGAVGAALGSVFATCFVEVPYLIIIIKRILKVNCLALFPWVAMCKLILVSLVATIVALSCKFALTSSGVVWIFIATTIFAPALVVSLSITRIISRGDIKDIIKILAPAKQKTDICS
jgi:O-antigen/teichoic acid export membrane protein